MQDRVFRVAVTCASRALILRDRLRGFPGEIGHEERPGTEATRFWVPSGANFLDAVLMEPEGRPAQSSLLICHGIGETVEHWRAAQRLLAEHGVCSLVFDYSGYGRSSGRVDAAQWERDAMQAFCFLQRRMGGIGGSVLGYSLGSGVAAAMVGQVPARRLMCVLGFCRYGRRLGVRGCLSLWRGGCRISGTTRRRFGRLRCRW